MTRESRVKHFMNLMSQECSDRPSNTSLSNRQLAIKLIFEELQELSEALDVKQTFTELCNDVFCKSEYNILTGGTKEVDGNEVNEVEVLDAFADIEYTCLWGINTTGLDKKYDEAFEEVCRSNDSKACSSLEEAEEGVAIYAEKGELVEIVPNLGKYVLKNKQTGKIRKSPNYSPAKLDKYVPTK